MLHLLPLSKLLPESNSILLRQNFDSLRERYFWLSSLLQSLKFLFHTSDPKKLFLLPAILPNKLRDRKSTRLNSSHANISYAVFCLKKKTRTVAICFRSE